MSLIYASIRWVYSFARLQFTSLCNPSLKHPIGVMIPQQVRTSARDTKWWNLVHVTFANLPVNISHSYLHKTKFYDSVFLKSDGNFKILVLASLPYSGNVKPNSSLVLSRFLYVSWMEIPCYVSVMFLSVDFRCVLFPFRFSRRIFDFLFKGLFIWSR